MLGTLLKEVAYYASVAIAGEFILAEFNMSPWSDDDDDYVPTPRKRPVRRVVAAKRVVRKKPVKTPAPKKPATRKKLRA